MRMVRERRVTLAVAAGVGLAAATLTAMLGRTPPAVAAAGVATALLAVAARIDLSERRVPNALTYGGAAAAILAAAIEGPAAGALAFGGCAFAGGAMGAVYLASRGRLGLGDVKLAAAVGALLGPAGVMPFLLASGVAGGLGGVWLLLRGATRGDTMAYAPALAVGAVITLLASGSVIR